MYMYVHVTCVSNLEWGDLKVELITEQEATQNWDGEQLLAYMLFINEVLINNMVHPMYMHTR